MTKEEFAALQLSHQESGKTLKEFLKDLGVGYSTYNYWRKKFLTEEEPHELAPISFRESSHHQSSSAVFSGDLPSGATLLFPNGLRAHFGTGVENGRYPPTQNGDIRSLFMLFTLMAMQTASGSNYDKTA